MRNEQVVEEFLKQIKKEDCNKKAKTKNLHIEGDKLINYTTVIATINGTGEQARELELNCKLYSRTTSTIQNYIIDGIRAIRDTSNTQFGLVLNGTEERIEQFSKRYKKTY